MRPLSPPTAPHATVHRAPELNDNEVRLLRHLARGRSVAQTATAMAVTTNTVRTHIRRIEGKLAVTSRAFAVDRARNLGVL